MKRIQALLFILLMSVFLFSSCENDAIMKEKQRLEAVETELLKAISEKNTEYAKLLCVKMRWQYVGTTAGAITECEELAKIWDEKSRSYLRSMGLNPVEILGEKPVEKSDWDKFLGK